MTKNLLMIVLVLMSGHLSAEIYKWIDDSGAVHYADTPPKNGAAQAIEVPKGPSRKRVERAQQEMQIKLQKERRSSEEESPIPPLQEMSQVPSDSSIDPNNVSCFEPLSDTLTGAAGDFLAPITPTVISDSQRKILINLLSRLNGDWRGTSSEVICKSENVDPKSETKTGKAYTTIKWNHSKKQLSIKTKGISESNVIKNYIHNIEVGEFLYFTTRDTTFVGVTHNETELLDSTKDSMSFLTKTRIMTRNRGGAQRAQIIKLELDKNKFRLTELTYTQGICSGNRTFTLTR